MKATPFILANQPVRVVVEVADGTGTRYFESTTAASLTALWSALGTFEAALTGAGYSLVAMAFVTYDSEAERDGKISDYWHA